MVTGNLAVRRDKNALVFFSRKDGTKIRLGLGSYTKASRPELVDISITDSCLFACDFCYRGSTPDGKHSTMDDMHKIVQSLSSAGVFEVALGGGEPTSHPDFITILREFRAAGVVPNFTTKSPAKVRQLWPQISAFIGAFAYSAETAGQVRMAHKVLSPVVPADRVNLHYVMGLGDREHFRSYLLAANEVGYRVTLLGYKTTGRGKEVVPHPYEWWIDEVNSLVAAGTCPGLSIDTPLADEYAGRMPVPSRMFHRREGAFSMFIDAVSMAMGASSFDEAEQLVPFDSAWLKRYQKL